MDDPQATSYEGVKEMEQFKRGSKNQMVQGNLTQAGGLRYLVRYLTKMDSVV